MQLSLDQVKQLAPDDKSNVAASQLLPIRNWSTLGMSEAAIWGIASSRGGYQVRIDLADLGYGCNCPSRKYPCKHVLAVLMLFATSAEAFELAETPTFVAEWIEKRRARAEKKKQAEDVPAKPVDRIAQAKRADAREGRIQQGLEQFVVWLDDLIREGIASLEAKPFEFWDQQARRLIDYQAKGLASRVRRFAEIPGTGPGWPQRLLHELGKTRILVQAYRNQETLAPELLAEIRQLVGWTVSQEELDSAGEVVADRWFIIGQRVDEEERFRTQRSWAVGQDSGREALLLQFAPGHQPFPESILSGVEFQGELVFYPGIVRQRAKIRSREESQRSSLERSTFQTVDDFFDHYADKLSRNPWMATCSCLLADVSLGRREGQWFVRDQAGNGLLLGSQAPYFLLAATGGHRFDVAGEWNGSTLTPLGIVVEGRYRECL